MNLRLFRALALVMLVSLVAACSSGDEDVNNADSDDDSTVAQSDGGEMGADEELARDVPAAEADEEESGGSDVDDAEESAAQVSSDAFSRRVIRNGELVLTVTDVNGSVRHAREIADDYGGYVEASSTRLLSEEEEAADLTLEVPSGDFDEVMSTLRDGPHVTRVERETTDSRDVTEEYVDLRSRLGNLESTESRFVALLDEADSIEDVMSVEREISRVRGEIEEIQGRLNYLEERTDNSRIHVTFQPDGEEAVEIAGQHFTPGETAREAWNASMEFVGTIANVAIAVVVFFWWRWPLLGIGSLVYLQHRRRRQPTRSTPTAG